jgi:hypothetical protein
VELFNPTGQGGLPYTATANVVPMGDGSKWQATFPGINTPFFPGDSVLSAKHPNGPLVFIRVHFGTGLLKKKRKKIKEKLHRLIDEL